MTLAVDLHHRVGAFDLDARFSVPAGLSVLFGPSGAGKSLTLRLVAGLDRPTVGSVSLDGAVLSDTRAHVHVPPRHRRVGMVFQQALLLPHRSALANVALAVRGSPRQERRETAMQWLERVGATEFAGRRPARMSGGQQQRVALARALAGRPRLLLLDEPFGALDLPVRRRLRSLVHELVRAARIPTLFVTHDRDELVALADHVVWAEHGSITRVSDRATALRQLGVAGSPGLGEGAAPVHPHDGG